MRCSETRYGCYRCGHSGRHGPAGPKGPFRIGAVRMPDRLIPLPKSRMMAPKRTGGPGMSYRKRACRLLLAGVSAFTIATAAYGQPASAPDMEALREQMDSLRADVERVRTENQALREEVARARAETASLRERVEAQPPAGPPVMVAQTPPAATPVQTWTNEGDRPAVSGLNTRLGMAGGVIDDTGLLSMTGSVTVPLGYRGGLQLDGATGFTNHEVFGGGALQAFWRDPSIGLIGAYGSYSFSQSFVRSPIGGPAGMLSVAHAGMIGELYLGPVSIEGLAGWEGGSLRDRFFDMVDVAVYPDDDLRLSAGHRYLGGDHSYVFGGEYQLPLASRAGVALFARAEFGAFGGDSFLLGARLYLGPRPKSLIARHREDDPPNRLTRTNCCWPASGCGWG